MTSTVLTWYSVKSRITVTMLAIFLVSLWSLSYYASRMLREDMERLLGEQQFSTVSLVAAEVNDELYDRFGALKTVAASVTARIQPRWQATRAPDAGRAYIEAYVPYVHYVERLWQAAQGAAHAHDQHHAGHGH